MKRSLISYGGILLLAVVLLLVNGVSRSIFSRFYLDLTSEGLYSLSDGTREILQGLEEPITLKFFFSKTDSSKFPAVKLFGSRIVELLREYERKGKGKVILEEYDPRPDTEEEEWAQKYGIQALPDRSGSTVMLGLAAVNGSGEESSIPLFDFRRQEYLEYDITKLIYGLTQEKKPVIGVLSGIDFNSAPSFARRQRGGKWLFIAQLEQVADVRFIKTDDKTLPTDLGLLLVIHPKSLNEELLYELDQFVLRGGNTIIFEDPYCQGDEAQSDPQNPMAAAMADRSSNLNSLTKNWGVELVEKKVVGDFDLASRVDTGDGGQPKPFILWPSLSRMTINSTDVVTSALENIILPWAGSLKVSAVEGVTIESLLQSSARSQLIDEQKYRFNGGDPDDLLEQFLPSGVQQNFAVRIRGKLKSNYSESKRKPAEGQTSIQQHLTVSSGISNVIVVADVDFISDRFSVATQNVFGTQVVSLLNDNQNFAQNAVENLLGSDSLIGIRSRGRFARPFTVVEQMEIEAQQRFQQQEMLLEAKLNNANQRLNELISSTGGQEKQLISKAVMDEIKQFREDKKKYQQELRIVRRNLRQNIERLGEWLFVLNTFAVPALLIVGLIGYQMSRRKGV